MEKQQAGMTVLKQLSLPASLPGGGKIKTLLLYELQRLRHIAACGREQVEALRERRHVHRAAITYCTPIYRSAY